MANTRLNNLLYAIQQLPSFITNLLIFAFCLEVQIKINFISILLDF